MVKNLPAIQKTGFDPWVEKTSWRREWLPTPAFLHGESHGQRSLVIYSPWGHKESTMTKKLTLSLYQYKNPFFLANYFKNFFLEQADIIQDLILVAMSFILLQSGIVSLSLTLITLICLNIIIQFFCIMSLNLGLSGISS